MILFAATVTLWVRSHLVRDYSFAWLPWPADTRGRRYLKVDADSGGGQVEVSWHLWTAAQRAQLRQRGGVGAADAYHGMFPDVPQHDSRSSPPTAWNAVGFRWYSGPSHTSVWLPYWSPALLTVGSPAAWASARARRVVG
jgi:hypothetical protein